jgi:hypothetical protein
VFPCNRGVSSPVFRLVPLPSYTASLITAVNCYSSGRRDDSWRRELGVDLKGRLCSTAQADEAVYASQQTPPGFAAASPDRIPASTSELPHDASGKHRQRIPPRSRNDPLCDVFCDVPSPESTIVPQLAALTEVMCQSDETRMNIARNATAAHHCYPRFRN